MLLAIWTKTEDNQIDKAKLHLGGGEGSRSPHKFQQYLSLKLLLHLIKRPSSSIQNTVYWEYTRALLQTDLYVVVDVVEIQQLPETV